MRKIVFILFLGFTTLISNAQVKNQVVFDEQRKVDILLGEVDMDGILGSVFKEYYDAEFDKYTAESSIIESLILANASEYSYTIVLGSWCSDSKREVPRMLKVLNEAGIEDEAVTIFGVNSKKEAPGTIVSSLSIVKVPTLIVFQGETEIGRIIETPTFSIEKDLLEIIE